MSDAPAAEDGAGVAQLDPVRERIVASIASELGDELIEHAFANGELCVRVRRSAWRRTGELLRFGHGFDYFCFLSGIDWLKSAELSSRYEKVFGEVEDGDEDGDAPTAEDAILDQGGAYLEGRLAGGDTRFQVFARVYDVTRHIGITVKADLNDENPTVDSWVPVYRGADWHERETWEMYGFQFDGHPGLRHIYLPGEFEGFPLRKDFPLLARVVKPWPGLVDKEPVPGEFDPQGPDADAVPDEEESA